jgi:hypothetical protein
MTSYLTLFRTEEFNNKGFRENVGHLIDVFPKIFLELLRGTTIILAQGSPVFRQRLELDTCGTQV